MKLTFQVSGTATLISVIIGVPLDTYLALKRFWGRWLAVSINFGMGLPPVVVGLITWPVEISTILGDQDRHPVRHP